MNFSPFGTSFPMHHFTASSKFTSERIQPGAMLVASGADGTIQYVRPEQNASGANFVATSSSNNTVQAIPISVTTSNAPTITIAYARDQTSEASAQEQQQQQHQQQQQQQQHQQQQEHLQPQLAAVINSAGSTKFHTTPSGAIISWGDVPVVHHFNDGKNIINIPYPPGQAVNSGATAILTVQPSQAAVWPTVRLVQNVSTMTDSPQDLCKAEVKVKVEEEGPREVDVCVKEDGEGARENGKDSGSSEEGESEDSSRCDEREQKMMTNQGTPATQVECHQIQLQQQGCSEPRRAPAEPTPAVSPQRPPTKKKVAQPKKPPRPRPGQIRLSTALDGSTLFCCPECHMAYPERGLLEQHLAGHKMERRFVCNVCGAGLKRKEHLDQHKRGHSDERPFVCSVCLKGFKRNEHLTRHLAVHSGDRSHACVECGKAFSRKDHLHKHAQTHVARRVRAELSQATTVVIGAPSESHITA